MVSSRGGRVGGGSARPSIRAGVISAAGAENLDRVTSTPYDHFAAGPNCGVTRAARGRIAHASSRPGIVNACTVI